ncbi:MAG: SanA protein, partial [Acidobacteria bacterium]|nr:SanA protein [Acidobacteriota bacterium]
MLTAAARGIALFLGGFTLLNVAGDLRFAGTNGNLWWIDLWPLSLALSRAMLIAFAIAMIAYAIAPRLSRLRLNTNVALITIVLIAAIGNTIRYYVILARGDVRTTLPLPLSLLIAAAMLAILIAHHLPPRPNRRAFIVSFVVAGIVFPIAQIALFGLTDYRRRADLIVVFGAHAFANGAPSRAVADRIDTGVELYRAGLAPRILFSGGPGDAP